MNPARLKSIPLFASLTEKDRDKVARWADEVDLPEGQVLAKEGEFAYEFFVIEDGSVHVTQEGRDIRDMGSGEFFGEIALDKDIRRTATVVTTSPVKAIVMTRRDFKSMEREMPEVCAQIKEAIKERT